MIKIAGETVEAESAFIIGIGAINRRPVELQLNKNWIFGEITSKHLELPGHASDLGLAPKIRIEQEQAECEEERGPPALGHGTHRKIRIGLPHITETGLEKP